MHLINKDFFSNTRYPYFEPTVSRVFLAPATCGELVQGTLDDIDFLVNFPIDLYAKAIIKDNDNKGIIVSNFKQFQKVANSISQLLLQKNNIQANLSIEIISQIPRGKGLASSTSEISAALQALNMVLKMNLSYEDLNAIQTTVDASDGILFPGVTRCNSLTGKAYESFANVKNLGVVAIDTGGTINTNDMDRAAMRAYSKKNEAQIRTALAKVCSGLTTKNVATIAEGATISASVHQSFLPKNGFQDIVKFSKELGALGVNCAHSGTIVGILFDTNKNNIEALLHKIEIELGTTNIVGIYKMTSGGVYEL